MASSNRRQITLLDLLYKESKRFNFFQAVRLIELYKLDDPKFQLIGEASYPENELIGFRSTNLLHFPSSEIESIINIEKKIKKKNDYTHPLHIMYVNFMCLTGTISPLPLHYSEHILIHQFLKNHSVKDFFDIFNQRTLSLYYSAWKKNQFFVQYEQAKKVSENNKRSDDCTELLFSLWGNSPLSTRNSYQIDDHSISFYTGLLSQKSSSYDGLELILGSYYGVNIRIEQYIQSKLKLEDNQLSRIGTNISMAMSNKLGKELILGKHIRTANQKFRIIIGPLDYKTFKDFLPIGKLLFSIYEWTILYIGYELSFDIQLIILKSDIPQCNLSNNTEIRLGWNSFLKTKKSEENAHDVIFTNNQLKKRNYNGYDKP